MGIYILSREGMGMFLNTMGMGREWEYDHGNEREWDRKGYSRTSLVCDRIALPVPLHVL